MFINSLKFLVRFSSNSMFDEISQTNLLSLGDDITPSVSTSGYVMQNNQYLFGDGLGSNGYNLAITNEYTLGFWFYSANSGLVVDSSTGSLLSVEKPILSMVDTSSAEYAVIEVTEHTQISGNNSLRISERGDYVAFSEEYEPNQWHYIWIARDETSLTMFIDGVEQTLQNESGALHSSVTDDLGPFLNLYINHSLDGYSNVIAKNEGIIDDIFFQNVYNVLQTDIQKAINNGILYVVNDIYTGVEFVEYSIFMNDPETITINSMINDLSYIFIGRNDGKIMRGSSLFWETRRSFSDTSEYANFDLSGSDSGQIEGFLRLVNDTIRL